MPTDSPNPQRGAPLTVTPRRRPPILVACWTGWCALAAACAGASPAGTRPDPPTVEVPDDPAGETPAPGATALGAQSCTLTTSAWQPLPADELGSPLRATAAAEPFVYITGGAARMKLAAGSSANAIPVTFTAGGVELRGVMTSGHLPLHLRRPVVFEGFAVPLAPAPLLWRGGGPDGVQVSYAIGGGLQADKLQASVPCGALSLEVKTFDGTTKILAGARGRLARLRLDRKSPLSATAGSSAVAWIDPEADDDGGYTSDQIREVAFDGTHSRVLWERPRDIVFGWVPADAIYVLEDDEREVLDDDLTHLVGVLHGVAATAAAGLRSCPVALPLFASIGGRAPVPVGTLKAGVGFEVVDQEDQMTSLVVPNVLDGGGPFVIGDDTRILAADGAVTACSEVP